MGFDSRPTQCHSNFVDKDQKVVDNGDRTLTILVLSAGGNGLRTGCELLFKDPGQTRFEVLIDHAGTQSYLISTLGR